MINILAYFSNRDVSTLRTVEMKFLPSIKNWIRKDKLKKTSGSIPKSGNITTEIC